MGGVSDGARASKEGSRPCSHGVVARGAGCLRRIAFSGNSAGGWWRVGVRGSAAESGGRVQRQPRGPGRRAWKALSGGSISPLFFWGSSRELSPVRSIQWGMRADLGKRRPVHDARGRLSCESHRLVRFAAA